ncbi:MAG: Rieske 2Fe-2S domain-containing protein [Rubrivivax sp.]
MIAADAVAPGQTLRVEREGRGLFVHRLAAARADSAEPSARSSPPGSSDEWRVWDSRCPHETTDIPHLALQGCTLTCPKHEWVFDVRSGACIQKGTRPLHHLPSRESQGRLLAQW